MPSIFTKIINGEIPCEKLKEDDRFMAFLDTRPINPGHTLVIPKKEIDYFFDLDDDLLSGIMVFAKTVAEAIEKVVTCERVGIIVAGLEVPHAHVHLVPFSDIDELTFARAKPTDAAKLAEMGEKIRANL